MGYNKQVYERTAAILRERKRKAEQEAEQRRFNFFTAYPRAEQIEQALAKTGITTARAVLKGGNVREHLSRLKQENQALQAELSGLLSSAHLPGNYIEPHYTCVKCSDSGYIDGRMCSCMKQELRAEAYRELNASSPLALCSFEQFSTEYYPEAYREKMERVFHNCIEYAELFSPRSPNLIFMGGTGLGKTHLSLAIAGGVIKKGYGVVYGSVNNIINRLEQEHFGRSDDADTRQSLIECDLLILDDLGTEFRTSFSIAEIYNIVNTRQMTSRPTIISTNLTMEQLGAAYTDRFASRIMADYKRVLFQGEDIRQKKRLLGHS